MGVAVAGTGAVVEDGGKFSSKWIGLTSITRAGGSNAMPLPLLLTFRDSLRSLEKEGEGGGSLYLARSLTV